MGKVLTLVERGIPAIKGDLSKEKGLQTEKKERMGILKEKKSKLQKTGGASCE